MFFRVFFARVFLEIGIFFIQWAFDFAGGGKIDVTLAPRSMSPEPFWVVISSLFLIPIVWVILIVVFTTTGDI